MTVLVVSLFLPYTVNFEFDPSEAAALCNDESLSELFEPVRKSSVTLNDEVKQLNLIGENEEDEEEDDDADTQSNNNKKHNPNNEKKRNISIIESLSKHNLSNTNLSINNSINSNNNPTTTTTTTTNTTTTTTTTTNPTINDDDDINVNHNTFDDLDDNDLNSLSSSSSNNDLKSKKISHLNNVNNSHNISAQDFFFNNPCKTKMNLSSTSLDDINSLNDSNINLNPPFLSNNDSNDLNNIKKLNNNSFNQFTVKPKPILRNLKPQPKVNEILQKKTFMEPKLSSMRLNRSQHSNMRNLKTSSIISLDKKINFNTDLNQNLSINSNLNDSFNPDLIFDDYTNSLIKEENDVINFNKNNDKITPFGGFSKPHNFINNTEEIFEKSIWNILEFEKGNGSLINSIEIAKNSKKNLKIKWIGTISIPSNIIPNKIKNDISIELNNKYDSNVIYLDDEIFDGHYKSFCKQILWPIFHYQIPDNPKSNAFENHSWKYYEKLNKIYADNIIKNYKDGDTIWIHDYHLMLLPQMLRELLPNAKIGFFLHISFPSSEVFRCLAQREKILKGMLGADCITFQNKEYMTHFLQSSNRLLLADFNDIGIYYKNRLTTVSYNAIGIDSNHLNLQLNSNIVNNWRKLIRERWNNKKLIVSRDKIDKIRGLKEKLLAYERFLDKNPSYINKTILILILIHHSSTDEDYKNELFQIIERINSKTKNISIDQPVILLNKDIEFEQYLALLSEANLFIVSTLREGMNLTCHEFICATKDLHSPLILSEFVGSASVLNNGPLLSNPYNIKEVENQIFQCLNMSKEEKFERWQNTYFDVKNNDSLTWITKCLDDINNACECLNTQQIFDIELLTQTIYNEKLNYDDIINKKLFILNLDDITSNLKIHGEKFHSAQQQLINKTLTNLSSKSNNYIYILSSLKRIELQRLYRRVPNIGLIAENGGLIKPPRSNFWYSTSDEESEKSWINLVVDIIKSFCERIPGSYIEIEEVTVKLYINNKIDDYINGMIGDLIMNINELFNKDNIHASILNNVLIVQESDLIYKALSSIYEDKVDISNKVRRRSSVSISPISPVLSTTTNTNTSTNLSFSSTISDDPPYDFIFICGSTLPPDEELYTFFNNISETTNTSNIISVCVGSNGKVTSNAKYSLKGINNLMRLLD